MTDNNEDKLLPKVMETIRASNSLAAQDVEFYRSIDNNISDGLDKSMKSMSSILNTILLSIDENNETVDGDREKLSEICKEFSNVMDVLFEKSDRSLDILSKKSNVKSATDLQFLDDSASNDAKPGKRISKPQLNFKKPVDNSESHPFRPLLTSKPHAMKTLEESTALIPETEDVPEHYPHPYEYEILNQEYNSDILKIEDPIESKPWNETSALWIDSIDDLKKMISDLKKTTEIAVDLEHHDYRSYYGIVCLMQISTREQDYLVDTIALRDDLEILNEIFANPKITKVFHGAFMDIIWLQRDLGLYIVSLFDTFHASKALGLPRHSLAFLLEKYAKFKTSKKYQLADWRVRPLSKAMNAYARADTHFLLNIFDQMRNGLIESNKLAGVLNESRNVAIRRFEYSTYRPKVLTPAIYTPVEKENPWRTMMYQYNIPVEKEPLLKELYEWRDMIARRDDESPRYIMANQLMVSLVAYTPIDPIGVISVSNMVSDHVRRNSKVLANLIKKKLEDIKSGEVIDINSRTAKTSSELNQDKSHLLSLNQIEASNGTFDQLVKSLSQNTMPVRNVIPSVVLSDIMVSNENAVEYMNEIERQVNEAEVKDRFISYIKATNNSNNVTLELTLESKEDNELKSEESISQTPKNEAVNASKEIPENKEEVVVLKKRHNLPPSSTKKSETEKTSKEAVDYAKLNVMNDKTGTRHKQDKKRRFDPYAAENEGPQAAKKRRNITRGKKISFKK
ncbi:Exosome complex exonuclease RRP6 [Nakaseomyces bracarensis]|uniref:Exosome complex exonuclease RRP6 n=1 Tax=Nakaseomyces bracarensis TaxID=273131 RepID=A0ABR4NTG2_9SACH